MELLEPAVQAFRCGDPSTGDRRDGAADHRRRTTARSPAYVDALDVAFQGTAPVGRGILVPADACSPRGPVRRRTGARRSSARSCRCCRSTTRPMRSGMANDTEYGLSGSIWTRDVGRAIRVARGVETGTLSVNSHCSVRYWTPFGGSKQSGLGRELGPDALHAFTDVKNVFIATDGGSTARYHCRSGCRVGSPSSRWGQRHRPRHRAPVPRGGRARRRGDSTTPRARAADEVGGEFVRSTSPRGCGDALFAHGRRRYGTSTSRSTTRASRRRTTTRSWTPGWRRGSACSRST